MTLPQSYVGMRVVTSIISEVLWKLAITNALTTADFSLLSSMTEDMKSAEKLHWPSPYWKHLIKDQIQNLGETGLKNFKRTLNMQYFNWSLKWIVTFLFFPVLYVVFLRHYVGKKDELGLLNRPDEPC